MTPEAVKSLGLPVFGAEVSRDPSGRVSQEPPQVNAQVAGRKDEPLETPFILSDSAPVVPPRLVCHILRAEYVDMAELLKDNMEAERKRMLAENGSQPHFSGRQSRREVPDILNWLQWWCPATQRKQGSCWPTRP